MKSIYVKHFLLFSIESTEIQLFYFKSTSQIKGALVWILTNTKIYTALYIFSYSEILCLIYFSHTYDCCSDKWLRFCLSRTVTWTFIDLLWKWRWWRALAINLGLAYEMNIWENKSLKCLKLWKCNGWMHAVWFKLITNKGVDYWSKQ